MSKDDSHPEAWLDRAPGQLREDEQRELERHLVQCDACALQSKLQPSLMDQIALLPGDGVLINGAIEHAVRGLATAPPPPALHVVRPGRLLAMTAAGALAVGSAGVAGVWMHRSHPSASPPAPTTAPPPAAVQNGTGIRPPAAATAGEQARSTLVPAPDLEASEAIRAPEGHVEVPAAKSLPSSGSSATSATAGARSAADRPRSPASEALPATAPGTSAELFARANALRRSRDYGEAAQLYRRLQTEFSGAPEVMLSRIVLGRLYLDQLGDPRAALRQFDAYLANATHTSLRDEAMIGRALAFGRLGRSSEERAAWVRFLDAYPGSMYVPKARARLQELGE